MNTKTNPPPTANAGASSSDATLAAGAVDAKPLKVAYHDGPPSIQYFGRRWERSKPQEVTAEDWAAMQARADFAPFQFKTV